MSVWYKLLCMLYPSSAHTSWKWSFPTTRHFLLPLKPTHRQTVQFGYWPASLKSSWAEPYSMYKAINRIYMWSPHIPYTKSAVVYECIHKCLLCYDLHVCRYLSFKMHMLMTIVKDWVSTTVVEENKSTGWGQKTEFKELEVNNYDNIPLYAFVKSWSKHNIIR